MEKFESWGQLIADAFQTLTATIIAALPAILGAIVLLLLGWGLARFCRFIIIKLSDKIGLNRLANKVHFNHFLENANITSSASQIVGQVVYWLIFLVFLVASMETMGWQEVSDEITNLISYLPKLLAAVVLFGVGLYLAQFIRDFLRGATKSLGISAGRLISGFVYYIVLAIVTLTALKQAGIDISVVTSNLTLIIGAVLLSAGISYGFASRHILTNILSSFFSRKAFREGQKIEFDNVKGEIVEIGLVSVTLKTENGHMVIPTSDLLNNRITIS